MSAPLAGKTALITGGSKGIGAATSLLLAKSGANVAINYSSDSAAAQDIAKQIGHERSLLIKGDAGSVKDIEFMVSETVTKFGRIDILISCAGILLMRNLEATTEADFDKSYRLNVKGPYFLSQKAAPHMPQGSHIVLLSTTQCAASTVQPPYLLYNSTKGAIEQMTRVMSKDLAPKGISVNAVAPGPTATELFFEGKSEQVLKAITGLIPMGRIGKPEEVAEAIVWLSSGSSGWISGQVLRANGGMA